MRRTTSLLMGIPKAKAICCAIRGQPHVGFRRFICTTATMTSWLGPFGPGFLRPRGVNSKRYFRAFSARWRLKRVEGLRDDRGTDQPPRADEEPTHRGDPIRDA